MKALFLSMDGVLTSWQSHYRTKRWPDLETAFCPIALSNLDEIIESTYNELAVVICSRWREFYDVEAIRELFSANGLKHAGRISHFTPIAKDRSGPQRRYEEIRMWLEAHPEVSYWAVVSSKQIIYDDWEFDHHLVMVDPRVGLDWYSANRVRSLLDGEPFLFVNLE